MIEQIKYREGYLYQLAESYSTRIAVYPGNWIENEYIRLSPNGDLVIKVGYAWDGPSGPTIDTKSAMRGSLIHDSLYELLRKELLSQDWRGVADRIYEKAIFDDVEAIYAHWREPARSMMIGLGHARAKGHFAALRAFGGWAASPKQKKLVLIAP